jgi:hypothetical protein
MAPAPLDPLAARGAPAVLLALVVLFGAAALVQTVRLWLGRALAARRLKTRAAEASRGEARAEALVAAHGFKVLGRQVTRTWNVAVSGRCVEVRLFADLVVQRRGRRYVAEVKTGAVAPRIDHAPTRRQLLEYRIAFDVDGVLLVDATASTVHEIEFALPPPRRAIAWKTSFAVLASFALAAIALASILGGGRVFVP